MRKTRQSASSSSAVPTLTSNIAPVAASRSRRRGGQSNANVQDENLDVEMGSVENYGVDDASSTVSDNGADSFAQYAEIIRSHQPDRFTFKSKKYQEGTSKKRGAWKNQKQIIALENYGALPPNVPTYENIEAPISLIPAKKYCDVTGFEAKYRDPQTNLRYSSPAIYQYIKGLPEYAVQEYLSIRKASTTIK